MGGTANALPDTQTIDTSLAWKSFINAIKDIIAGSVRGVAQVVVGHPLDTIKVRLQTQTHTRFTGVIDCFWKTLTTEGVYTLAA